MRILSSSTNKYFWVQQMKCKDALLVGSILGFSIMISKIKKWVRKTYSENFENPKMDITTSPFYYFEILYNYLINDISDIFKIPDTE